MSTSLILMLFLTGLGMTRTVQDMPVAPPVQTINDAFTNADLMTLAKDLIEKKLKLEEMRQALRNGLISEDAVKSFEAMVQELQARILQEERSRQGLARTTVTNAKRASAPTATKQRTPKWIVRLNKDESYSTDPDRVKERTLEKACAEIAAWIREQDLPLSQYKPSLEFLRRENVIKSGPNLEEHASPVPNDNGKIYSAWVEVELMPEIQKLLINKGAESQRDCLARATFDRAWVMTRIILVGLFGVIVTVGYFLIDERVQGYFSKTLLIGAIGLFIILSMFLLRSLA